MGTLYTSVFLLCNSGRGMKKGQKEGWRDAKIETVPWWMVGSQSWLFSGAKQRVKRREGRKGKKKKKELFFWGRGRGEVESGEEHVYHLLSACVCVFPEVRLRQYVWEMWMQRSHTHTATSQWLQHTTTLQFYPLINTKHHDSAPFYVQYYPLWTRHLYETTSFFLVILLQMSISTTDDVQHTHTHHLLPSSL